MTRDALMEVRRKLGEIDDLIYRDCRARGEDSNYTEDETTLSTMVDEAQGQTMKMVEAIEASR